MACSASRFAPRCIAPCCVALGCVGLRRDALHAIRRARYDARHTTHDTRRTLDAKRYASCDAIHGIRSTIRSVSYMVYDIRYLIYL
eukprot:7648545-Lingulodinium_polyedra.AAC.1